MNLLPLTIAQAEAAPATGGSPLQFPIMMVILFAIMYFMMIRPQKRREKERKEMINSVKSGARVLLTSGIIGEVINVKENTLIIKISDNTKVECVRAAISQILEKGETPAEIEATK
ncbi:preprotein translocase subunit YajC [Pontiella agarivorans]|uniref:Sec translocon accessory complex subunit YajC n=1 Tax=Pontiella agarivorans TaxID=3038953 RepID=A0ABU5MSF5_9BACT|nr:preprotein translocase subunit YajC [Pontiella agarivorans]MDZ8117134.1 preprotein translocase subunit YajC [Pontiella agarivorans]